MNVERRTPTLSYTKTLEARIVELEAELGKRPKKPESQSEEEPPDIKDEDVPDAETVPAASSSSLDERMSGGHEEEVREAALDLAGDIEGLNIEEDGRISFHGPTSLFQLPSGLTPDDPNPVLAEQGPDGRKERLINNAWRERAFEQLTTIPVRPRLQEEFMRYANSD